MMLGYLKFTVFFTDFDLTVNNFHECVAYLALIIHLLRLILIIHIFLGKLKLYFCFDFSQLFQERWWGTGVCDKN